MRALRDNNDAHHFLEAAQSIIFDKDDSDECKLAISHTYKDKRVYEGMLKSFYVDILAKGGADLSLINGHGTIFLQNAESYASIRRLQNQTEFLYLHGHLFLELVLEPPINGAVLREYRSVGVDEMSLRLRRGTSGARLELVSETPCRAGQIVVKRDLTQVFDWVHDKPLRTLRAVVTSSEPYELVFDRSGAFLAALESNFRSGLLQTVTDIFGEIPDPGNEAKLLSLTGDFDPIVAWSALRRLDQLGSPATREVLESFAAGDVPLLSSAAQTTLHRSAGS